jgi:hypothetical protein
MSDFKVTEIINSKTIRVEPSWQLTFKNGTTFMGDKVVIRGLDLRANDTLITSRLQKLLVEADNDINFNSPELVNSDDEKNAIVSCSVYLAKTNILYYFPEYVHA